jgi:hypothetical protein
MKKTILYIAAMALTTVTTLNSCIRDVDPQTNYITAEQAKDAPGS